MRRILAILLALAMPVGAAAAEPPGLRAAAQSFDEAFSLGLRIQLQIRLIAAGYFNGVPIEHLGKRLFEAVQNFQGANGFPPDGRFTRVEIRRLAAESDEKLVMWGFRTITHPTRPVTIWAPLGLDLDVVARPRGLHYEDRQGRLELDILSYPAANVETAYRSSLADWARKGWLIHYPVFNAAEGWFVVSATSPDGHDHYYRYHQDGAAVTGFALEWNNAAGNINAERIAIILSGSLRAAMTGAPFTDPPEITAPDPVRQVAVPAAVPAPPKAPPPAPSPAKTDTASTGTGVFVSEDGHLVTNAHVVKDCSDIAVKTANGNQYPAQKLAADEANDLALLRVGELRPAVVAALRPAGLRLGEGVEAFGFPHADLLASSGNFTLGNVTALAGLRDDARYLQISAPVQAGNSGGPLLDASGNLVGVVSAKLDAVKVMLASDDLPQNVNFAVKAAMVASFLDARGVAYKVGVPGAAMMPADLADQARAMSAFVVCR